MINNSEYEDETDKRRNDSIEKGRHDRDRQHKGTMSSPITHQDSSKMENKNDEPYSVFTTGQKRFIVFMVSVGGLFSPLSANIYYPALPSLSHDMRVSAELINLTVTSYMIFQGISPMIVGDFADGSGRRPAYAVCFLIYIGANIGLALQDAYPALFLLRCLQSAGSSGTIALANAVVADVADKHDRGGFMGYALAGRTVGPAIGPVLGGVLSQYLGWRAMFWFLSISSSLFLVPFLVFFPETGRNVVGNGSIPPKRWNMSWFSYQYLHRHRGDCSNSGKKRDEPRAKEKKKRSYCPNPMHSLYLLTEKDILNILVYTSIPFTAFYCVTASFPNFLKTIYKFNYLQIGLCYIPAAAGSMFASIIIGKLLDWNFKRIKNKMSGTGGKSPLPRRTSNISRRRRRESSAEFPIERARLQVAIPLAALGIFTTIGHGWALHARVHLAIPLVTSFFIGFAITGMVNCSSTLLVDLCPLVPATATAAFNFVRCLLGAVGTAVVDRMINSMGVGWCFTFWGLVCLAASPMLAVAVRCGPKWRKGRVLRSQKEKERKEKQDLEGGTSEEQ